MHENEYINVRFGNRELSYRFLNENTGLYFRAFQTQDRDSNCEVICSDSDTVEAFLKSSNDFRDQAHAEYWSLLKLTASALLKRESCIFHAAAFIWRGRAWLLTAPSGTGKTTQYRIWRTLYGDRVRIINGDKPILEMDEDGNILVCPSAWSGKENYGSLLTAPLGGIIWLEQGDENSIRRTVGAEAVPRIFSAIWTLPENEEEVAAMSRITEAIVTGYPVWKLTNRGDAASVEMTRRTIDQWIDSLQENQNEI